MICESLVSFVSFFRCFTVISSKIMTALIINTHLIDVLQSHAVMTLKHNIIALSSLRWCQIASLSMNILSSNLLVIHSYDITIVSTDISFLFVVIVRSIHLITSSVICLISCAAISIMTMDSWKFLWGLIILIGVHAKLLVHVVHVLWCSKVLQNVCHVIITVSTCIWSSS